MRGKKIGGKKRDEGRGRRGRRGEKEGRERRGEEGNWITGRGRSFCIL